MCPRKSALLAQCDNPNQLKVVSSCLPNTRTTKSKYFHDIFTINYFYIIRSVTNSIPPLNSDLHCLGSWTSGNMVRFLLSSDDKHDRYSAYYYNQPNKFISLHVALIRPPNMEPAHEMHVKLTHQKSCADLYSSSPHLLTQPNHSQHQYLARGNLVYSNGLMVPSPINSFNPPSPSFSSSSVVAPNMYLQSIMFATILLLVVII